MHEGTSRRTYLSATAGVLTLAGCLGETHDGTETAPDDESEPEESPSGEERTPAEPTGSWPSYQRTRLNAGATDPGDPPVEAPTEAWTFETGDEIHAGLAIHDGVVYVPSEDEHLYALDLADGTERWAFDAETGLYNHSPAVAGNTVYQTNGNGTLFAIDIESGLQWTYEADIYVSRGAVVSESAVFFGDNDDTVYAVDRATGSELWTYEVVDPIQSPPTYHDGAVYVSSLDEHIYKLDAESGTELWNHRTDARPGSPTVYDGTVYASTTGGTMYALEAESGSEQWTAVSGGMDDAPTVTETTVYGDSTYGIDAWDRSSGERLDEVIDTDGLGDATALVDDTLYFASEDAVVYAVDPADGSVRWSYDVGYAVEGSPAVGDGYVIVGTTRGAVHALK